MKGGGAMLSLNLRDSRPIYEQVRDGLRRLIITGAIPAGDKLPLTTKLPEVTPGQTGATT